MISFSAGAMTTAPYTVRELRRDTRDTFTLELARSDGRDTPFQPGQFNMLYARGVGEAAISISGDPAQPERLIHTIRRVGRVTDALGKLRPGKAVGVRGPFGKPWPIEEAQGRDALIIAGGIGLAPLRPLLLEIARRRDEFRGVALLYGARDEGDLLYRQDLKALSTRHRIAVHLTVDRATDAWKGAIGVVTGLVRRAPFNPQDTIVFICGPEVMIHPAERELERRGAPKSSIFLSIERNMNCGYGVCGHCQFGPHFVCRDGPVFRFSDIDALLHIREV